MPTIADIRQQYPQYNDMPDGQLADALHAKYYADMPQQDFYAKIGMSAQPAQNPTPFESAIDPSNVIPAAIGMVGKGIGAAANWLTPDLVNSVNSVMTAAGELPTFDGGTIGQEIPQEAGRISGAVNKFGQDNPAAGVVLDSLKNTAKLLPVLLPPEGAIEGMGAKAASSIPKEKLSAILPDDARHIASADYKLATEQGGDLGSDTMNGFLDHAESMVDKSRAAQAKKIVTPLQKYIQESKPLRDMPLDLASFQHLDEELSGLIDDHSFPTGKIKKEGLPFVKLQDYLRSLPDAAGAADTVSGTPEGFAALKRGAATWSDSYKLSDIERIETRAETADNAAQIRKSGYTTLRNRKGFANRYTPEEQALIKRSASTGAATGVLRLVSSRLVPIAAGFGGGGVIGAGAAYGVGRAAGKAADILQSRPGNELKGMISGRIRARQAESAKVVKNIPDQMKENAAAFEALRKLKEEQKP